MPPPANAVQDITPAQSKVHKVTIAPVNIPALIAAIDPTAPAGKSIRSATIILEGNGELVATITYTP